MAHRASEKMWGSTSGRHCEGREKGRMRRVSVGKTFDLTSRRLSGSPVSKPGVNNVLKTDGDVMGVVNDLWNALRTCTIFIPLPMGAHALRKVKNRWLKLT